MLVSYRDREIEVWTRESDGWTGSTSRQGDRAELDSIGSYLVVAEVYDAAEEPQRVALPPSIDFRSTECGIPGRPQRDLKRYCSRNFEKFAPLPVALVA